MRVKSCNNVSMWFNDDGVYYREIVRIICAGLIKVEAKTLAWLMGRRGDMDTEGKDCA